MRLTEKIRAGMKNPRLAIDHIVRRTHERISNPKLTFMEFTELYHSGLRGKRGVNVMDKDWDNLVILDSCRYDIFTEVNTVEGEVSSVTSVAGWTQDFLRRTFRNECYPDTVYISANPMIVHCNAFFHARVRLWETDWSAEYDVVLPERVTDAALETADRFPDKRLIVHFMQPHYPFIGELGQQLLSDGKIEHYENGVKFWGQVESAPVTREEFWNAYQENLAVTMPHLESLVDGLEGRTVITSDHGNVFDYHGIYGHMRGYTDELRTVPWLVTDRCERKSITPGSATAGPRETVTRENQIAMERLRQLGYA